MYRNDYGENDNKILIVREHAVQVPVEWARGLVPYPR